MRLEGVPSFTTAFTDRPYRDAQLLETSTIFKPSDWGNDLPNIVMAISAPAQPSSSSGGKLLLSIPLQVLDIYPIEGQGNYLFQVTTLQESTQGISKDVLQQLGLETGEEGDDDDDGTLSYQRVLLSNANSSNNGTFIAQDPVLFIDDYPASTAAPPPPPQQPSTSPPPSCGPACFSANAEGCTGVCYQGWLENCCKSACLSANEYGCTGVCYEGWVDDSC